jgi:hypothetical protein
MYGGSYEGVVLSTMWMLGRCLCETVNCKTPYQGSNRLWHKRKVVEHNNMASVE